MHLKWGLGVFRNVVLNPLDNGSAQKHLTKQENQNQYQFEETHYVLLLKVGQQLAAKTSQIFFLNHKSQIFLKKLDNLHFRRDRHKTNVKYTRQPNWPKISMKYPDDQLYDSTVSFEAYED